MKSPQLTAKDSLQDRVWRILNTLKKKYPDAHCALLHQDPYELLVATVLSAQCTDARVNLVTPAFFRAYPNAKALSKASQKDVEGLIFSTGFYRAKAKNLCALGKELVKSFEGKVPETLKELESLPGVGRKTANVVLGNAFGVPSGIAVDTHVTRLVNLLRFVRSTDPKKIEERLKKLVPSEEWIMFTHVMISHGREVCIARRPKCDVCVVSNDCPSAFVYSKPPLKEPVRARSSVRTHV